MTESTPADFNNQFSVPGLRFEYGPGKLVRGVIDTPAARGEFYLNGAHVTAWQPAEHQPVLWMSAASNFAEGKPIRGGIPLCFPWFGPHADDPSLPAHGWARTSVWELSSAQPLKNQGISIVMTLTRSPYRLTYQVDFSSELHVRLLVETEDSAAAAGSSGILAIEEALHTYFTIGDIHQILIEGLESADFIDKVPEPHACNAVQAPIQFSGETDRVYQNTKSSCRLIDPVMHRMIIVDKSGSDTTVVWNPWIAKSARMADFGDHEWPGMVCIETANAGINKVQLKPGDRHEITATIRVQTIK